MISTSVKPDLREVLMFILLILPFCHLRRERGHRRTRQLRWCSLIAWSQPQVWIKHRRYQ